MIDMEGQIRDFFTEEADRAAPSPGMYERVLRRSRSRRIMTTLGAGLSIIAVLVGVSLAVGALRGASQIGFTGPKNLTAVHLSSGQIARIPVGYAPQPIAADDAGAWVVSGVGETTNVLWHIDARTQHPVQLPETWGAVWPGVGEGFAWVTCNGTANPCGGWSLLKLDPTTGATLATIPLPGFTSGRIAAGLGSVWVPTNGGLVKIDPVTAKVVATYRIDANDLGVGGGGVWAINGQRGVIKIDPRNGSVTHRVLFPNPCGLVATDVGVWVSSCRGPHSSGDVLLKIDSNSGRQLYRVRQPNWGPVTAVFANGQLWLARWIHDHVRIEARDPENGRLTGTAVTVRPGPQPWSPIGEIGPPVVFTAVGADSFWLTHVDEGDVVRVGLAPN